MKSHKAAVTKAFNMHHFAKKLGGTSNNTSTPNNMKTKHPKMKAKMAHK